MLLLQKSKKEKLLDFLLYISFWTFAILLIWGIYFKANRYTSIIKNYNKFAGKSHLERLTYDIIPFKTLLIRPKTIIKDFILNAIAFLPFGIYLPLINKKHTFIKGVLFCFLFSLCFELTQFITIVGTFSTNDLIANTFGYVLGTAIYMILGDRFIKSAIKYINVIVIILVIPFLLYEFSDTLSHFSVYLYKTL